MIPQEIEKTVLLHYYYLCFDKLKNKELFDPVKEEIAAIDALSFEEQDQEITKLEQKYEYLESQSNSLGKFYEYTERLKKYIRDLKTQEDAEVKQRERALQEEILGIPRDVSPLEWVAWKIPPDKKQAFYQKLAEFGNARRELREQYEE